VCCAGPRARRRRCGRHNADNNSATGVAAFTYDPSVAPAPSNPGATDVGLDSITWTWQDNTSNETGFKVYATQERTRLLRLRATTVPNVQSWLYSGLDINSVYSFQVAAATSLGDSYRPTI